LAKDERSVETRPFSPIAPDLISNSAFH